MAQLLYVSIIHSRELWGQVYTSGRAHRAEWCCPCVYTTTLGYEDTILTLSSRLITQSGLLAAVAAQLLTIFKDDSKFKQTESETRDAILTLIYIALIASIFATVASVALTIACSSFNLPRIILNFAMVQCTAI